MTDKTIAAENGASEHVFAPADEQFQKETRMRYLELYRAALNGDWGVAEGIYDKHKDDIPLTLRISKEGDTALHIAAAAKHTDFVKELVSRMDEGDLAQKNNVGNTALCLAAASGKMELAKLMMKNKELAKIRDNNGMLPVHMAASLGHKEMVQYLYQETRNDLDHEDRIELLVTLINTNLFDVALELLMDYPDLATSRDGHNETALHALARKPLTSSNFSNQNASILRCCFNLASGAKYVDNKKLQAEALELVKVLWEQVISLSDSEISKLIGSPWRFIFVAAEQGNVEFLTVLIREYPDLIWKVDERNYSIFHIAVLNRQEDIFKLIYEIGSIKDLVVMSEDKEKNNILHLAGMLAPSDRLNIVSGAALQMQRELLWFKEVSKVVQPLYAEARNEEGFTPRALFTKKHEELREKGEKWMKDTATSCMLVATLIATVVFAAAFTVPGGNKEDTGLPLFIQKVSFKVFAISDAISLISSSTSIVTFLSILTSRYAEEDFLWLLPKKLLIGLTTLFISITAMMVVFSATFFILFNDRIIWVAVLVTVLASSPVIMFILQHHHLFFDVVRSTYISDSLFQPAKSYLFCKKGAKECEKAAKKLKAHSTISTNV